jgi:quinol monooxygenase YgiN
MAPHVTFFRMKAKPGERQSIIDLIDKWMRDRRPDAPGFVRVCLVSNVNDPDEFMSYAMFADKDTYDANSQDPEQDAWYKELRQHLVADPVWFDGKLERQKVG